MAIVQISQITQRKGRQADLPNPLAGAELGWSTDTRQLWIGNGTLADGAPVVGNTEILTEFSDILNLSAIYTYKGEAAGYVVQTGPTPNAPVKTSLQSWLDQYASVKDFGAVGDGITDDTEAINRALYQLYCIQPQPPSSNERAGRRSLFFPAGTYLISDTLLVPPYANLVGEGANSSVIQVPDSNMADPVVYMARTTDSLQQTGVNIGNGAPFNPTPGNINISNIGFVSLSPDTTATFLVEKASECDFSNVLFAGVTGSLDNPPPDTATFGVSLSGTTSNINIVNCEFSGLSIAVDTNLSDETSAVVISTCAFSNLLTGIELDGAAKGIRITQNTFVDVSDFAINAVGTDVIYCISASNAFFNNGARPNSYISFEGNNNLSIGDVFSPVPSSVPAVDINNTRSIAMTNGTQIQLGTYTQQTGTFQAIVGTNGNANAYVTVVNVPSSSFQGIELNYSGQVNWNGNIVTRVGKVTVSAGAQGELVEYNDDYVENYLTYNTANNVGIMFNATEGAGIVSIGCVNPGPSGNILALQYTVSYFNK